MRGWRSVRIQENVWAGGIFRSPSGLLVNLPTLRNMWNINTSDIFADPAFHLLMYTGIRNILDNKYSSLDLDIYLNNNLINLDLPIY